MINRIKNKYLKDQTKSLMNSMKGCKHAIYGLCYYTPEGNIVEEIADNASPALADIRRHMRIQSAKIKDSLQKVISSPAYAKLQYYNPKKAVFD